MNYWDSSAILPLLVVESTTTGMQVFYEQQPEMVAWWGTPVECASALARLEREGQMDATSASQAIRQLESLQLAWHEVQPVDVVRQVASRLLRAHPLCAADGLQLAAALVACEHQPRAWQFICLDNGLATAAEREGFRVVREFAGTP
ncbi:MAG: type II toxin-antitoxin system VapC family toxin [Gammaproteobacteria bacterium]|nr:type II toxin-antitoxin system VapC family toxin [Gammaproteobacteria bacterium]MBU1647622.1 type II toxin-antitoxin system VapC family toxin [Gammaproteobacteria bacterium]MBU1971511.1 type II toxin-antitoxin system VapC family toxin [Gammaproteobacteria bacterium]